MPQDSKRGYQIYHSILGMILTLAIILWINEYYVLKVNIIVCILYSIIPAVLLFIFDIYKKHAVSYLVLISLLPVSGLVFYLSRTNPIKWISEIIDWVIRYNRTENTYEKIWAYTVLAFLSAVGSIIFFIIVRRLVSRLLLTVVIVILFVVFAVMNMPVGKATIGIGIFYILNILIELSGILYGNKTGKKDKKESILYLLPVCILLAAISVGLPSKSEPIQWTGVKNLYYSIRDQINKIVTEWEFFVGEGGGIFSVSLTGYSGDGSLDKEKLVSSKKIALIVTGKRGLSPIYLTGSVNDVYTGFSWEKSREDYLQGEMEYQMDYAELLYGLSGLEPKILEDYRLVESKPMTILYNNIKTKTFFYPLKCKWIQFDRKSPKLDMEHAGITFSKARGSGTAYNLSFYEMNLQEPEFQKMLRNADGFSYDVNISLDSEKLEQIEKTFIVRDKENFLLRRENYQELFKERADIIYNNYTQLPESLPSRVKNLAYEITKDEDTRYDKLKAIEAYLLKYEYSLTPGTVPEGVDFVDYFLFENKKGYCTSFATAMAILARSIGIPTRYVEGYVVNYNDKDDIGFLIRNSNAHAWAEAYFDGIGWIPFEATPSYHEQRYTPWAPKQKYQEINYNRFYQDKEAGKNEEETAVSNISEDNKDSKDSRRAVMLWILVFAVMIIVLLVLLISYYLILRHRYSKDYDASDNSMKMYKLFLRILTLLKYEGFTLDAHDTLIMLSDRVKDRYQYENIKFGDIINIFMAYRYGEIPVTDKQLDKVQAFYKGLQSKHESETKKLKLHIEEFLFLVKR